MPELSHSQAFKIVHGAVMNTIHAHPDWFVTDRIARSVAKRAAGTLVRHQPELALAAKRSVTERDWGALEPRSGGGAPCAEGAPIPPHFINRQTIKALSRTISFLTALKTQLEHSGGCSEADSLHTSIDVLKDTARKLKNVVRR